MMKKVSPKNGHALSGENFIGRLEGRHKVEELLPALIHYHKLWPVNYAN